MTLPENRERTFTHFAEHTLAPFWQQRQEGYFIGQKNIALYWLSFVHSSKSTSVSSHQPESPKTKGAVVLLNGRVESSWKYQEVCFDLYQQGYDVYAYDHRGQGLSPRLASHSEVGHIDNFDYFVDDATTFIETIVRAQDYQHIHLLAHSMGGTVATRLLQHCQLSSAALCAPMYDINLSPFMKFISPIYLKLRDWSTTEPQFAPRQGPYFPKPFEGNLLTHSEARYQWFRDLYSQHPKLQLGGASNRWVTESLRVAAQCRAQVRSTNTPLLILQAENEQIVDNRAQEIVCRQLKATRHCVPKSRHEILFETDEIRNSALKEIFAFFQKAEHQKAE